MNELTWHSMYLKMVIVVRKDLNMRKGKIAAQVAHAAQEAMIDRSSGVAVLKGTREILSWLGADYKKIVVSVDSEAELLALVESVKDHGMNYHLVRDLGCTEFHGLATYTALAIGPAPLDLVDALTGNLKLL